MVQTPMSAALGENGRKLIQSFEKLALKAYRDVRGVLTIGWGHTGPEVREAQECTPEEAEAWFTNDIHAAVLAVLHTVDVALTANQFDALVAFTFNVGAGSEAHSTLVKLLNAGHPVQAAEEFMRWNHVNGVVCDGLSRRREAERALFLTPDGVPAPVLH